MRSRTEDRARHEDAAVVDENLPEQRETLARSRQGPEHREVPEQDLEQERQVADQFHIAAGEPRQQPIGREPRDPDKKPQHRGKHDADGGDQQRVEQTDEEDPPVGILLTVWNERLADTEPGGVVEKAKAAGDLLGVEIGLGIEREFVPEPQHRRQQHELVE